MSLLTNPWFAIGTGLLANSGPSRTPINPWMGVNDGLLSLQAAKQNESIERFRAMQEQEMQRKMAQQQRMDQLMSNNPDPMAQAFPELAAQQHFAAPKESTSMQIKTAGELGLQGYPPNTPVEVKMVNGQPIDYAPMVPPVAADPRGPTGALYDAAREQGYKGSLMDFINSKASASAPKIEMGGADRVSPSEAASMVYEDGTSVLPGESWETARARGARIITNEEKAAATKEGSQDAVRGASSVSTMNVFDNYKNAGEAYHDGVMPWGANNEAALIARKALVMAYAKATGTLGAEPSEPQLREAEKIIPDFAGPLDRPLFASRMAAIKKTLQANLSGKRNQDKSAKPIEGSDKWTIVEER